MTFGLIGYPLTYSFSRSYFTEKFRELGLSDTHRYLNFEMETVDGFLDLPGQYPDLRGCNVTIPHKQSIIPLLDELDPAAERIGAVNCILFEDGRSKGFNTDYLGFRDDLLEKLDNSPQILGGTFNLGPKAMLSEQRALVLGTGGASLAIHEALRSLGMETLAVSRTEGDDRVTYADLTPELVKSHLVIVNTTPLGMSPRIDTCPDIPYEEITAEHFCYDVVYNPAETLFLKKAKAQGAGIANGMGMLHGQAEAGWAIWRG
ncbi:shikimate dehydrogenase [Lewinella sp. W8]|uniref:shikimate dehydrogenase family protein n=1 Tax=Lewinella sp. W8 TaxID=2528208 RepID=UPI0010682313|nr:shikimate dehydrogenase [Lewinella sp. W8]MTB51099.1 shikimate dehydrogenase [Lewinella sp. W8]